MSELSTASKNHGDYARLKFWRGDMRPRLRFRLRGGRGRSAAPILNLSRDVKV